LSITYMYNASIVAFVLFVSFVAILFYLSQKNLVKIMRDLEKLLFFIIWLRKNIYTKKYIYIHEILV